MTKPLTVFGKPKVFVITMVIGGSVMVKRKPSKSAISDLNG